MWSDAEKKEIDTILEKYPNKKSAIMPVLYIAQRKKNWLDNSDIAAVAEVLDLHVTHVHSIVGFYTLFRKEETGRYIIQFCTDLPCALKGAEGFFARLCERMDLPSSGGTTSDGMVTIEPVVCIAACDKAPCCQINLDYYEDLTDDSIDQIIAELRAEAQ
ncbi:MAG: NAD(P)H-dependent oxidoreductase subunit E [Chloroflexota bacterium]